MMLIYLVVRLRLTIPTAISYQPIFENGLALKENGHFHFSRTP
jgi:hypothetical protein